jgi:hypothetical protein
MKKEEEEEEQEQEQDEEEAFPNAKCAAHSKTLTESATGTTACLK